MKFRILGLATALALTIGAFAIPGKAEARSGYYGFSAPGFSLYINKHHGYRRHYKRRHYHGRRYYRPHYYGRHHYRHRKHHRHHRHHRRYWR